MAKLPSQINLSSKVKWEGILKDVDKNEIPVEVMERVIFNIVDGTKVEINIRELLEVGSDPNDVQRELSEKLKQLEIYIANVDFHINIEAVASTIQPVTDNILRNL